MGKYVLILVTRIAFHGFMINLCSLPRPTQVVRAARRCGRSVWCQWHHKWE